MRTQVTQYCLSLLLLLFSHPSWSQENFGITDKIQNMMVDSYAEALVEHFVSKVDEYNNNHKDIHYFVAQYKDENDRRFVNNYIKSIQLTELQPFTFAQGRVRLTFPELTVELGPIELHERRVILDGKHYQLDMGNSSPRVQLVQIKELIETHLKSKRTPTAGIQRIFSWLEQLSPISVAHASRGDENFISSPSRALEAYGQPQLTLQQRQDVRLEEIAGALLLVSQHISFTQNAQGQNLNHNIREFANVVSVKKDQCQRDLARVSETNNQYAGGAPTGSPSNHIDTFPLIDYLKKFSSNNIMAINEMKRSLRSHLSYNYSPRENRQFCRENFQRAYASHEEDQLNLLCNNLEELKECSIEFLSQSRIYDERIDHWQNPTQRAPANTATASIAADQIR